MTEHPPFYTPDGDGFLSTEHTRGPWSPQHQHAGPPSALLVRAGEPLAPGQELARFSCELLRPVPIARVTVDAEVTRPGKKTTGVRARLMADGKVCMDAQLLFVRTRSLEATRLAHHAPPPPPAPEHLTAFSFPFFAWPVGYHTAIEGRVARGVFGQGSMALWMRPRGALVQGELPSGAQRALVVADAGSGVSIGLDTQAFSFANADLTVLLQRAPAGDWLCVDATTWSDGNGRAIADSALWDQTGWCGRGVQTLVVEPRS